MSGEGGESREKSLPVELIEPAFEPAGGGGGGGATTAAAGGATTTAAAAVAAQLVSCDGGVVESRLLPGRSLSPRHAVDGAQRTTERGHRNASVDILEHERGSAHSLSRRIVGKSPQISERVSSEGQRMMEICRRNDYPEDMGYEGGTPVSYRSWDWVQSRSSPSYRVDRRSHLAERAADKGPTPVVMRLKYDYPEKVGYADEKHLRVKHAFYDDNICDENDGAYSRSSPPHKVERGSRLVERISYESGRYMKPYKRYDYAEDRDVEDEANGGMKQDYYYVDEIPIRRKDYRERSLLAADDHSHRTSVNGLTIVGEGSIRQAAQVHLDSGFRSDCRSRKGYPALNMLKREDGDIYQVEMPPGKFVIDRRYHNEENYIHRARDAPYHSPPRSQYKNFDYKHLLRVEPSTSSAVIMKNSSQGCPPTHDGYRKSRGEPLDNMVGNKFSRRPILSDMGDLELGHSDMKCHQCDICNSSRVQHEDYNHPKLAVRDEDHSTSVSYDGLHEKMPSYTQADHFHGDFPREHAVFPMAESSIGTLVSSRILRNSDFLEADVAQKEKYTDYIDTRRRFDDTKHTEHYFGPGYKHDYKPGRSGLEEELGLPGYKPAYQRAGISGSQVETIARDSEKMGHIDGRPRRPRADEIYHKHGKRKYSMNEEIGAFDYRIVVPKRLNKLSSNKSILDSGREWTGGNSKEFHSKEPDEHRRDHYLETEQMFDEIDHYRSSVKENSSAYRGKPKRMLHHSVNPLKSGKMYSKGYSESESSNAIGQTHHVNRRGGNYMSNKVWRRSNSENDTDLHPSDANVSNDAEGPFVHDPSEETEGFKQMVNAEFLNFYKKLNENPTLRKLYKEEGRSVSLFCIVCGRKSSKEFLNTQQLVTHAYMSRKANLRAQHLGLHKAVSILMGWNCVAAPDIVTWVPHVLPAEEAAAQKEDLILWPPIIIVHNISLSHNNHTEWSVLSTDDLGEFMRSQGFNLGKMTICLGNPGDQSVILVKFLGTFSGLREAERFHRYFTERKHGRTDLDPVISNIDQNDPSAWVGKLSEKVESLLYGYMAIAEDLDRIDFNTKKRCLVKSKKEIQVLAEAPLKPE